MLVWSNIELKEKKSQVINGKKVLKVDHGINLKCHLMLMRTLLVAEIAVGIATGKPMCLKRDMISKPKAWRRRECRM